MFRRSQDCKLLLKMCSKRRGCISADSPRLQESPAATMLLLAEVQAVFGLLHAQTRRLRVTPQENLSGIPSLPQRFPVWRRAANRTGSPACRPAKARRLKKHSTLAFV